MACPCENRKLASEYDRIRTLAKALAKMEGVTVVVYCNPDGTYGFCREIDCDKPITEYISPY